MKPRRPLTQRQKRELWERQGGKCAFKGCNLPLVAGRFEDDHHLARIDGGSEDLSNRRLICTHHHREKSKREHKANRKAGRLKYGKTRKSAPMPGSRKSRFKKHLDGSVSYR